MKRWIAAYALALLAGAAQAQDFRLTDLRGNTHALADYRGRWVVLNVWATWCAPCIHEMPELEAFSKARPDLVVLGLAADGDNAGRVRAFAQRLGVTYPIVAGDAAALSQFHLRAYPTTLVFDPAGTKVLVKEGQVTRQELEGLLTTAAR